MASTSAADAGPGFAASTTRPPSLPGFLLGLGLGGFIDGIVLHQILQWHHMLTDTGDYPMSTVGGLEANTLAMASFAWLRGFSSPQGCCWRSGRGSGANWPRRGAHSSGCCWLVGACSTWSKDSSTTRSSASTTCVTISMRHLAGTSPSSRWGCF